MSSIPWKTWTSKLRAQNLDWNTPCENSGDSVLGVTFQAWFDHPKHLVEVDAWHFAQRLAHLSKTAWLWLPDLPAHEQPSVRLFLVFSSMEVLHSAALASRWSKGLFPPSLSVSERKSRWDQVFEAMDHFQRPAMCEAWLRLTMTWWRACIEPRDSSDPSRFNHIQGLEKSWREHQGFVLGSLLERVPGWLGHVAQKKGVLGARETWEALGRSEKRFRVDRLGQELFNHSEVVSALEGWVREHPSRTNAWETSLAMDAALALWCHTPSPKPSADAFMEKALEEEKQKAGAMLRQLNAVLKGSEMPEEQWERIIEKQALLALGRRFPLAVERWQAHQVGQALGAALPSVPVSVRPRI